MSLTDPINPGSLLKTPDPIELTALTATEAKPLTVVQDH